MDAQSGPSPRSRHLQGPRPPRLAVRKDSHKVEKPAAVTPPSHNSHHLKQPPAQRRQHPARAPVVIHASPRDFRALVQRLTGLGADPGGLSLPCSETFRLTGRPVSSGAHASVGAVPLPLQQRNHFHPEPPGDLQVGVDSGSMRRLFQQLLHFRATISSSSGALPSDAWFNDVKHLSSDAQGSLEDLHYKMILAMLGSGRHRRKVISNVSGTCSKTASTSFIQLPSPDELAILSITDKLESLEHGKPGLLSGAVLANNSDIVSSLSSLVMRCILLCRGILGIMSIVGAEGMEETVELPVFAFDDLTYAGQKNKVTRMSTQSIPASVVDPIYLLPIFIRSLQYLDLSSCSSLTQLPPSIGNLHNLAALNLSHCYSLCSLPVPLGRLKNLQILVLSSCHALRSLPVSLCELSKLRFLDLSGCSSLENLPDSLVNLGHLENLNLSNCKELKELPQAFASLQELKYLNLSGSHVVDLDAEYLCALANIKCLTLSPLTNIQGFPDSFRELANGLDRLWWKKYRVHPQCNQEVTKIF